MISQTSIQEILNRTNILDVVGDFIQLKKRGTNYLGLCPFHNEKTPSFTVSPAKEIYKCFGCGKSGNTISFIMEHEKYSYVEALKWLAKKYNVEVEETFATDEQKQAQLTSESLYIVNQFAREFFTNQLLHTDEGTSIGLSYLKHRGFTDATIEKFQLGYNPSSGNVFAQEAITRQYNTDVLLKTGLVVERNNQLYDNYRERIIFPIHNQSGKISGFGARVLTGNTKAPKYINTPENEVYVKSKILYGSYFARMAIDKADECLLVEGYTDVISLHQAGIENVVASGGTSLTIDQLRLIKKYTNNLTILYDGDNAGVKAAMRGLDLALEEGLNVQLVLLPENEDPDSYVKNAGTQVFNEYISANKTDFILFQLKIALKDAGDDPVKKSAVVNRIAETISKINKAEDFTRQQDFIKKSSEILKIEEQGMHALVNQFIRNRLAAAEKKQLNSPPEITGEPETTANKDFSDHTFNLLFQDELQEKELARVLIECGDNKWNEDKKVADYIFEEMPDESLIQNNGVNKIVRVYKDEMYAHPDDLPKTNFFVYHPDQEISTLSVALLNFPYEQSEHWKNRYDLNTGYQKKLFEVSFEKFIRLLATENENELNGYLKSQEDNTLQQVTSALSFLKLKKIRRLIVENQQDIEKPHSSEELQNLLEIHNYLKEQERHISEKMGTVILK